MPVLPIARMGADVLKQRAEEVMDFNDPALPALVDNMLETIAAAEGVGLVGGPTSRYEFADLNCARAPFDHVDMRRAVSLATDRQAIVDLALLGEGEPLAGGPIGPPGHPFFANLEPNFTYGLLHKGSRSPISPTTTDIHEILQDLVALRCVDNLGMKLETVTSSLSVVHGP